MVTAVAVASGVVVAAVSIQVFMVFIIVVVMCAASRVFVVIVEG